MTIVRMKKLIIRLIKFYQKTFSNYLGKNCRFHPTCSNYAIEAYEKYNFFKATWLSIYRILRCNPFNKGGYDPVPLSKKEKKNKFQNGGVQCLDEETTVKE